MLQNTNQLKANYLSHLQVDSLEQLIMSQKQSAIICKDDISGSGTFFTFFFKLRLIDFIFSDLTEIFGWSENQNNKLKNSKLLHTDEGSSRVGAGPCGLTTKCT